MFTVLDAKTGKALWNFNTGALITAGAVDLHGRRPAVRRARRRSRTSSRLRCRRRNSMATRTNPMAGRQSRGQQSKWHFALGPLLSALREHLAHRPARRRSAGAARRIRPSAIAKRLPKARSSTTRRARRVTARTAQAESSARRSLRRTAATCGARIDELFDAVKNGIAGTQMPPFSRTVHRRSGLAHHRVHPRSSRHRHRHAGAGQRRRRRGDLLGQGRPAAAAT